MKLNSTKGDADPQADLRSNILKVLASSIPPKTSAVIHKALPMGGRPGPKDLRRLLAEMTASGLVVKLPGKTEKFIAAPIETWTREMLLAQVASGEKSAAKLKKALPKEFESLFFDVMSVLTREGRVFEHPPLTATGKVIYATTAADPLKYIAKEVDKLVALATKKGFSSVEIRDAVMRHLTPASQIPAPALHEPPPIIDAMRRLEPRIDQGAAVSIATLRNILDAQHDKTSVDVEILALAREAILELHSHPWPARLSAEDKSHLIEDGRGGWFDSIALRRRSA